MQPIDLQPKILPLQAPGLLKPTSEAQHDTLKHQVEEFASILYANMFTEMREAAKSEEDEESAFGGGDSSLFMSMFDQQVGKTFAARDGGGLKDALYKQLSNRLDDAAAKGGPQ